MEKKLELDTAVEYAEEAHAIVHDIAHYIEDGKLDDAKALIKNLDQVLHDAIELGHKEGNPGVKAFEDSKTQFNNLAKQAIAYIRNFYDPHTTIIIDCNHAEVLSGARVYKAD